jgi:hypothetical protein
MKTPIITEEHSQVRTAADLINLLSQFPLDTKIHGAFDDPVTVFVIFHPNFGTKTISIE